MVSSATSSTRASRSASSTAPTAAAPLRRYSSSGTDRRSLQNTHLRTGHHDSLDLILWAATQPAFLATLSDDLGATVSFDSPPSRTETVVAPPPPPPPPAPPPQPRRPDPHGIETKLWQRTFNRRMLTGGPTTTASQSSDRAAPLCLSRARPEQRLLRQQLITGSVILIVCVATAVVFLLCGGTLILWLCYCRRKRSRGDGSERSLR